LGVLFGIPVALYLSSVIQIVVTVPEVGVLVPVKLSPFEPKVILGLLGIEGHLVFILAVLHVHIRKISTILHAELIGGFSQPTFISKEALAALHLLIKPRVVHILTGLHRFVFALG
jgi:hypothetical protein